MPPKQHTKTPVVKEAKAKMKPKPKPKQRGGGVSTLEPGGVNTNDFRTAFLVLNKQYEGDMPDLNEAYCLILIQRASELDLISYNNATGACGKGDIEFFLKYDSQFSKTCDMKLTDDVTYIANDETSALYIIVTVTSHESLQTCSNRPNGLLAYVAQTNIADSMSQVHVYNGRDMVLQPRSNSANLASFLELFSARPFHTPIVNSDGTLSWTLKVPATAAAKVVIYDADIETILAHNRIRLQKALLQSVHPDMVMQLIGGSLHVQQPFKTAINKTSEDMVGYFVDTVKNITQKYEDTLRERIAEQSGAGAGAKARRRRPATAPAPVRNKKNIHVPK